MIKIKNFTIFKCDINKSFHWSKLSKLLKLMHDKCFNLSFADLSFANLRSADLSSANLSFANLRSANLSFADLSFANLSSANLSSANLSFANLRSANLSSANLSSANLRSADLSSADLSFADLSFANLRSADLSSVNLSFANLRSADLSSADLRSADLSSAKLKQINNNDVIIEDFISVVGLGSQNRTTLIFKTNQGIVIQCGCFYGLEKDFKKKVKETHQGNNFEKEYLEMLKLAKIRFKRVNNGK